MVTYFFPRENSQNITITTRAIKKNPQYIPALKTVSTASQLVNKVNKNKVTVDKIYFFIG